MLGRMGPRDRKIPWAVWLMLMVVAAHQTAVRTVVWRDNLSLWTDAVHVSPMNVRAHVNRLTALKVAGRWEEAIDECAVLRTLPATESERRLIRRGCPVLSGHLQ